MRSTAMIGIAAAAAMTLTATAASAGCLHKGAVATSGSAKSAKWFVMETMVQSVSWGLWPGFLATGKVDGYVVKDERYRCHPDGVEVTCRGRATFCPTK